MFFQPLVECPACLSNVCSAACPTGNLINYSCFLLWRGAVFQLHQGLSECPVRVEADSDIQGEHAYVYISVKKTKILAMGEQELDHSLISIQGQTLEGIESFP